MIGSSRGQKKAPVLGTKRLSPVRAAPRYPLTNTTMKKTLAPFFRFAMPFLQGSLVKQILVGLILGIALGTVKK